MVIHGICRREENFSAIEEKWKSCVTGCTGKYSVLIWTQIISCFWAQSLIRITKAEEKLEALAGNQYGIIYITEDVAAECEKVIEKFKEQLLPAVILIPGVSGNTGNGVLGVKKSVEQAVGSDILFGSE